MTTLHLTNLNQCYGVKQWFRFQVRNEGMSFIALQTKACRM
jgi:hypothetical protein